MRAHCQLYWRTPASCISEAASDVSAGGVAPASPSPLSLFASQFTKLVADGGCDGPPIEQGQVHILDPGPQLLYVLSLLLSPKLVACDASGSSLGVEKEELIICAVYINKIFKFPRAPNVLSLPTVEDGPLGTVISS